MADLSKYPKIEKAIEDAVEILASALTNEFFTNPELDCVATLPDGSRWKLIFERVDVDEA